VPSQGDAELISLLGGGRASEVACTAATERLPRDDETSDESEKDAMSPKMAKKGYANELEALVPVAFRLFAADATIARTPSGVQVPRRLNEHGHNTAAEMFPAMTIGPPHDTKRFLCPRESQGPERSAK
jgi:hypothetical protein